VNFPFYIAKRYVRSRSSQNAINIINFITFLVIVIGAAALFIVLSGFAGLRTFSLSFSESFDPDLKAVPKSGKFFSFTETQRNQLSELVEITSFAPEIEERVYLSHEQKSHVAVIKGVDDAYPKTTGIDSTIYWGKWEVNSQLAVAGIGVANLLSLTLNDFKSPLVVLAPKPGEGSLGKGGLNAKPYNEFPLVLSGVFAVEEALDKSYVFAELGLVQALLEKDSSIVSGINFKLASDTDIPGMKAKISKILGGEVQLKNRQELNSTLYRMLNTENMATYLIFTLVLVIALFNVVGAIIMMILDKQQNSRTLYSLGTTIKEIRRVYFMQGVLVTSLGGLLGILLASILVWTQIQFGWLKITPSLAYPVEFRLVNVLIVLATIIVLGVIASKIASSRVTKKILAY
jgi:lipoprotein-releasing system permease protein